MKNDKWTEHPALDAYGQKVVYTRFTAEWDGVTFFSWFPYILSHSARLVEVEQFINRRKMNE